MERKALDGMWDIKLLTPFITMSKSDIAHQAEALHVPIAETWSC
jgi:7-cyano-7-deazaguanine synthase in queuosine biosynthesis